MRAQAGQGPVLNEGKRAWGRGNWLSGTWPRALYARRTSSQLPQEPLSYVPPRSRLSLLLRRSGAAALRHA